MPTIAPSDIPSRQNIRLFDNGIASYAFCVCTGTRLGVVTGARLGVRRDARRRQLQHVGSDVKH